eukprot:TRINITY_DN15634_c0_g1_i2.p1 TRINITY_DN15634_c0_g1~~TRINITY_DN15634_c0_g1_i2.p1  ORF type:complete len:412 (-),score=64.26 TRINITY_DN15634_c0_g1_i2:113-1348(-)
MESVQQHRIWLQRTRHLWTGAEANPPPRVEVGIGKFNMAILWSTIPTTGTDVGTILSAASEASYLGKWSTEVNTDPTWSRLLGLCRSLICCPCRRSKPTQADVTQKTEDGRGAYSLVPHGEAASAQALFRRSTQLPGEVSERYAKADAKLREQWEAEADFDIEKAENYMAGEDISLNIVEANANCSMESTFKAELHMLSKDGNRLRRGSAKLLVSRMVLSRTNTYLDALELYTAAVTRLHHCLRDRNRSSKDVMIARVEVARFELNGLLQLVEPFTTTVLPALAQSICALQTEVDEEDELENRKISHNLMLSQLNLDHFTPQCQGQLERCKSMIDQYDREAQDKVNNILNVLTYITFVVTPLTILTGLYGMNFAHMPELEWRYGYHYFWVVGLMACILCGIALKIIFLLAT